MKPNRITVEYAGRSKHDIDQILGLNRLEYGPKDIIATRADFAWRCDENPAGPTVITVMRDPRGDIVGYIFLVPIKARIRGADRLAAMGTNLVIQSDYRNTVGYVKLIRQFERSLRENSIPLHYSFISEKFYRQLRGRGTQTACTIPLLIKPLNLRALIEDYFPGKWQRLMIRQAGRVISPFFFTKPSLHCADEIVVQTTDSFDSRFDEFWEWTKDKYSAMVIRDRAFLSWRFAPVSGRDYHILAAYRRDQMLGYMVIRCATVRGIKTGLILDLLLLDHPRQMEAGMCLISQAEAFFRTREMSLAAALMSPQVVEYRILFKSGYRCLAPAISPRPFRLAFFLHDKAQESLKSLTIGDWFITFADHESH